VRRLTGEQARRIALAAQGLTTPRPRGRVDVRHFRRVMGRMGLLQLDSVNALVRSHYLPVFSRLGPYDRTALDRWTTRSGEVFEYWGHEASLLPVEKHVAFRFRMQEMKPWSTAQRLIDERPGYIDAVYEEVAERGPLTAADLDDPGERSGPWWGYAPGKTALEWLFAGGRVTAYRTPSFGRRYVLPEDVIPPDALERPDMEKPDAYRLLLEAAARHHGVGTAADLADYYRLHLPTARGVLDDLATSGVVVPVEVAGWTSPAYLHPAVPLPRRSSGTALVSPFDPIVWKRDRVERLFSFRYRIEIYVPEAQRIYGYYVLPFLLDGEMVARVDVKADRRAGHLLVRGAFPEPGGDTDRVARALMEELREMARWLGPCRRPRGPRGGVAAQRMMRRRCPDQKRTVRSVSSVRSRTVTDVPPVLVNVATAIRTPSFEIVTEPGGGTSPGTR